MRKFRFLPLFCALLLLLTAPPLLAQQDPPTPYAAETVLATQALTPAARSLRSFLYPHLLAQDATIDLPAGTSYALLLETMRAMENDYPELFHVGGYSITYYRDTPDIANAVTPEYLCSASEAAALRQQMLDTARAWVADSADPLVLFDRLVSNTVYTSENAWAQTAVGALLSGEAICTGYAQALSLLYRLSGIPCGTLTGDAVTSDGVGAHAWNVTNFGFLDPTWAHSYDGHVFHSNYAMREEEMLLDHTPWESVVYPDLSGVQNYYQSRGLYLTTDGELWAQLLRLVDGEAVEVQFSSALYERYAGQFDRIFDLCAEATGSEIPFYGAFSYVVDENRRALLIFPI